ncbi:FMN-linked oxidoreductase [Scenedesmus sp. NREL 46B-D3]|nr:FMN-linked oxidoreductase [Scenedesmus sp. NREL 46B-D3]
MRALTPLNSFNKRSKMTVIRREPSVKVAAVKGAPSAVALQQYKVLEDAQPLFQPLQIGNLQLQHRIVMAPLTRNRAPGTVPADAMAVYYSQRATQGGLLISEATCISQQGQGYPNVPGIHDAQQVEAWRPVVQAVHDKGGLFFCQLWHVGRASHQDFQTDGGPPVGPSPVRVSDAFEVYTPKGGPFKYPMPRALQVQEIQDIVQHYAAAARNAIAAGFDGIEVHGANGYLLDQFWKDSSNLRDDEYGGSDENKGRLMLEVMEAVAGAIGPERCGVRLSPYNSFLDAQDSVQRAIEKNVWLMQQLDKRVPGLAYIHMVEPRLAAGNAEVKGHIEHDLSPFRKATSRPFLAAGGFKRDTAIAAVAAGEADAVVFGRYFISNPDLVRRLATDAPLNKYDRDTFYASQPGQMEGYIDYPFLEE